jgi:hypothetical protein
MERYFADAGQKPSPLMGEGWVGVNAPICACLAGSPHPKPLPIKGRGIQGEGGS